MRNTKKAWICLAALTVCRTCECGSTRANQAAGTTAAAQTNEQVNEALVHLIQHQLQVLPYYSVFDIVSFSLQGNQVTLTGQVVRPTLKAHAEAAMKTIEGVGSVVNNVEVLPPSASDDELRRDVYRALFEDKTLERYAIVAVPPIHIIVKNGAVTLVGSVESDADKTEAATRARSVDGVLNFVNALQVQPEIAKKRSQ